MSKKITLKALKSLPSHFLMKVINKGKKFIKNDEVMIKICKDHDVDISIIDYIPTYFKDLDVSAKTDHGIVYLSYNLLLDGFDKMDYGYLVHEYCHWFEQCLSDKPTQGSDEGNYLDNPHEQRAFTNQVEYISNNFGEDEAEEYVDDLLEHHDIDDENEIDEKKEILLSQV